MLHYTLISLLPSKQLLDNYCVHITVNILLHLVTTIHVASCITENIIA